MKPFKYSMPELPLTEVEKEGNQKKLNAKHFRKIALSPIPSAMIVTALTYLDENQRQMLPHSFILAFSFVCYAVMFFSLLFTVQAKEKRKIESKYFLAILTGVLGLMLTGGIYTAIGYHTPQGFRNMVIIPALLFMISGAIYTLLDHLTRKAEPDSGING